MSFCTYIASDKPLSESNYLWPLSRGGEDIYAEKVYVAQMVPDLDDPSEVLSYIQNYLKTAENLEIWHILQGVESEPAIRSQALPVEELTVEQMYNKWMGQTQAVCPEEGIPGIQRKQPPTVA